MLYFIVPIETRNKAEQSKAKQSQAKQVKRTDKKKFAKTWKRKLVEHEFNQRKIIEWNNHKLFYSRWKFTHISSENTEEWTKKKKKRNWIEWAEEARQWNEIKRVWWKRKPILSFRSSRLHCTYYFTTNEIQKICRNTDHSIFFSIDLGTRDNKNIGMRAPFVH